MSRETRQGTCVDLALHAMRILASMAERTQAIKRGGNQTCTAAGGLHPDPGRKQHCQAAKCGCPAAAACAAQPAAARLQGLLSARHNLQYACNWLLPGQGLCAGPQAAQLLPHTVGCCWHTSLLSCVGSPHCGLLMSRLAENCSLLGCATDSTAAADVLPPAGQGGSRTRTGRSMTPSTFTHC